MLLAAVKDEFDAFTRRVEAEQSAMREQFVSALDGLRDVVGGIETALSGRIEDINSEVCRLREAVDLRFTSVDESCDGLEKRCDTLREKIDGVNTGLVDLADIVEKQLSATERGIDALRESGERRVRDLDESHRRHVDSLERSREELLRVAERSRERLTGRLEEVADFLEQDIWPAVPLAEPGFKNEAPSPGWKRPVAALRHWFRRGTALTGLVTTLRERTDALEEVLRERWEESRRRGRSLRRVLVDESDALPSLTSELAVATVDELRDNVERTLAAAPETSAEIDREIAEIDLDLVATEDDSPALRGRRSVAALQAVGGR